MARAEYRHVRVWSSPEFEALSYAPASAAEPVPLLLYLHGAGEIGEDLSLLLGVGATGTPLFELEAGTALPLLATRFAVVAPQSRLGGWDADRIARFVDRLLDTFRPRLDPQRLYVTGHSMGGAGALVAAATTRKFAACAPVAPAGAVRPRDLLGCPTWAFHGQNDQVVPAAVSERLITGLRHHGAPPEHAKLSLYPDAPTPPGWPSSVGHASTIPAYATPALYSWLLTTTSSSRWPLISPHLDARLCRLVFCHSCGEGDASLATSPSPRRPGRAIHNLAGDRRRPGAGRNRIRLPTPQRLESPPVVGAVPAYKIEGRPYLGARHPRELRSRQDARHRAARSSPREVGLQLHARGFASSSTPGVTPAARCQDDANRLGPPSRTKPIRLGLLAYSSRTRGDVEVFTRAGNHRATRQTSRLVSEPPAHNPYKP
eukprot:CAMPEP_0197399742 /NCGR_PEP_ID=MMETSP1165-20131217/15696_1 /TAXON_ID=284809 /ORGANISM="Chrysocystis fragilis, Strain CCMP3189" /LENGTH=430 /DNA_ID=CAMNT_0042925767 /DNA_START=36 /DNA_END=1326 /DNA_ORIENTATION=+